MKAGLGETGVVATGDLPNFPISLLAHLLPLLSMLWAAHAQEVDLNYSSPSPYAFYILWDLLSLGLVKSF